MDEKSKSILIVISSIILLTIVFLGIMGAGFLSFLIGVFSLSFILIGLGFRYGKKTLKIMLLAIMIIITLIIINMNMADYFKNRIDNLTWYPQYFVIWIVPLLFVAMALVVKYCKKTLKIVLSSIIVLTTLYCVMLYIDIDRVTNHRKPIFVWETNNISGVTYQGLGYKVIYDTDYFEDGRVESESTTMYNMFGKRIVDVSEVFVDVIPFNQTNIVEPAI